MANLGKIKKIIDYIVEKDPSSLDDFVAAEHDEIYLPIPKNCSEEELREKGEELGFRIREDSIHLFV